MYNGLLHAHSGLRWIALLTIVLAVIFGALNMKSNESNRKNGVALVALIVSHIQLLIGLILMYLSPKVSFAEGMMSNKILRFFTIEHTLMMVLAIILITVGYSGAKRKATFGDASKRIAIFYGVALLLILSRIPWPFMGLGSGWF